MIEWPLENDLTIRNLKQVLESRKWWSREGEYVKKFQFELSKFLGIRYVSCCSSGTTALEIALKSLEIGFMDYVIVPSITFIGTATSVLKVGAIPLFADINPATACIDLNSIKELIDVYADKVKALIVVHLGGQCCDMDLIIELAGKKGLVIIEDCAQSIGTTYKGKHVGSFGEAGCFSFQNSKNITAGEGGAIVTNDLNLSIKINKYLDYNFDETNSCQEFKYLAGNNRMTEFQGAVLFAQLAEFPKQNIIREYNYYFLLQALKDIPGIVPVSIPDGLENHGCHLFMFRYKKEFFNNKSKEELIKYLNDKGIACFGGYDTLPLDKFVYFKEKQYLKYDPFWRKLYEGAKFSLPEQKNCENAEQIAKEFVWINQFVLLRNQISMQEIVFALKAFSNF